MPDSYHLRHAMPARRKDGDNLGLDRYSQAVLVRVWKAQHFPWWMKMMLHTFPDSLAYDQKLQGTEPAYLFSSKKALGRWRNTTCGLPF